MLLLDFRLVKKVLSRELLLQHIVRCLFTLNHLWLRHKIVYLLFPVIQRTWIIFSSFCTLLSTIFFKWLIYCLFCRSFFLFIKFNQILFEIVNLFSVNINFCFFLSFLASSAMVSIILTFSTIILIFLTWSANIPITISINHYHSICLIYALLVLVLFNLAFVDICWVIWNWHFIVVWWSWLIHHRWLSKTICLERILSWNAWSWLMINYLRNLLLSCATHSIVFSFNWFHWNSTLWCSSSLNWINLRIKSAKTTVGCINFLNISLINWIWSSIWRSFNQPSWTHWGKV